MILHLVFIFTLLAKHRPYVEGLIDSRPELVYIAKLILHERAVGRNNLAAVATIRISRRVQPPPAAISFNMANV